MVRAMAGSGFQRFVQFIGAIGEEEGRDEED
jgi:hypothetical protein